jgi:hypothetical protein
MVPPEGMAVVGVKAREMGTRDLPTTRSEADMVNETAKTRERITPDDKAFDTEHKFLRNLTPKEPFVGEPIVKPRIVMVTTADAAMAAPEVVITISVAAVAPHVAVRPATLLAPEATVGITEDAKKSTEYERVKVLPERMETNGVKTRVTETDAFPDTRSDAAMPNVDKMVDEQKKELSQITASVKEESITGV